MGVTKLVCTCGHKESEHAISFCHKCDICVKYKSIGTVVETERDSSLYPVVRPSGDQNFDVDDLK